MSAKYKVGDLVDFHGNKGIVKKVTEQFYFYSADHPFYEYDVEMTGDGGIYTAPESSLKLVGAPEKNKFCECGAWAVHWASNHHANYCPAALKL